MTRRAVFIGLMIVVLGGAAMGCRGPAVRPEDGIMIPVTDLPQGWRLMNSSEMPPIDKTPWWQENPHRLGPKELRDFDVVGAPTTAVRGWAVIYAKDEDRAVVFWLTYPNQRMADSERMLVEDDKEGGPQQNLIGFSKQDDKTLVAVGLPAMEADRAAFVKYFKSVTKPGQ